MDEKYTNLINVLSVPKICPNIQGQNLFVYFRITNLQELQLADNSQGEANVDILIGADLYWQFVTG